jgi:aspartate aminotransferase
VLNALKKIPGIKTNVPDGAFYVFPDVSYYFGKKFNEFNIQSAEDLCMYLLSEALVAVVTGEAFGDPNCIRISYAASNEVLESAMERIRIALEKLQ